MFVKDSSLFVKICVALILFVIGISKLGYGGAWWNAYFFADTVTSFQKAESIRNCELWIGTILNRENGEYNPVEDNFIGDWQVQDTQHRCKYAVDGTISMVHQNMYMTLIKNIVGTLFGIFSLIMFGILVKNKQLSRLWFLFAFAWQIAYAILASAESWGIMGGMNDIYTKYWPHLNSNFTVWGFTGIFFRNQLYLNIMMSIIYAILFFYSKRLVFNLEPCDIQG